MGVLDTYNNSNFGRSSIGGGGGGGGNFGYGSIGQVVDAYVQNKINYREAYNILRNQFGLSDNDINDVLIEEPYALIYQNRTCYCVGDQDPTPISIVINSYNGKNITYRNFYAEIEKKWDKDYVVCNHNFLEGISIKNNIIELEFGS